MLRYKSRKRLNAECRRDLRLGRELCLGSGLRRDIILGQDAVSKESLTFKLLV